MSFRPRDTLRKLVDAGIDPDSLLILEKKKADYLELGLPRQGIAKSLALEGVLKFEGRRRINYHKYHNEWGRGIYYPMLMDHYKQNREELRRACGLPL
ncbi:MAG: hypothetical protein A4E48_00043 [Methanosaeta sp. PtaU1.Bin060]|nr:MAG: hypothetical protein A4E48_00043 [Methanosaeta sp. PtaU1.Bin060]